MVLFSSLLNLEKWVFYSLAYVTGYKSAPGAVTTFLKTKQLSTVAFKQSNRMVSNSSSYANTRSRAHMPAGRG